MGTKLRMPGWLCHTARVGWYRAEQFLDKWSKMVQNDVKVAEQALQLGVVERGLRTVGRDVDDEEHFASVCLERDTLAGLQEKTEHGIIRRAPSLNTHTHDYKEGRPHR